MPTKPKEVNQLNVVSFETNFQRMPATDFFCQRVNIPSLALGNAILPTQFSSVPVEGDTLVFENLTISFYVNEDLSNYMEVYNWLISIGFPSRSRVISISCPSCHVNIPPITSCAF